ncbi:DUF305 domain-containing protein [Paraflavitalea sp. CAU 1676]|uniref:DUF305 domain-containing protein n=1 Tax=Paraflavitalea sp. CAU 1676 TaxID=3032598 RepID=UPI0023DA059C|nr:DUF305 domain-containing protein [Paraflavitalea sp. CAU 1676]MDF2188658.1 DUF305 domain-containing protein [Paraflavitalea sp. CAU 1676]
MKKHETATHHHGENSMMGIMQDMSNKMGSMQMKGDVDHDFADMMIVHHQAAIDMAQQQINSGHNDTLKKFARKIIEDQSREIRELEQWLKQSH